MKTAVLSLLAGLVLSVGLDAAPKPKLKPAVDYAQSWDGAVEQARALNVPLIVHRHGFY